MDQNFKEIIKLGSVEITKLVINDKEYKEFIEEVSKAMENEAIKQSLQVLFNKTPYSESFFDKHGITTEVVLVIPVSVYMKVIAIGEEVH